MTFSPRRQYHLHRRSTRLQRAIDSRQRYVEKQERETAKLVVAALRGPPGHCTCQALSNGDWDFVLCDFCLRGFGPPF